MEKPLAQIESGWMKAQRGNCIREAVEGETGIISKYKSLILLFIHPAAGPLPAGPGQHFKPDRTQLHQQNGH